MDTRFLHMSNPHMDLLLVVAAIILLIATYVLFN